VSVTASPTTPPSARITVAWLGLLCGVAAAVLFAGKAVLVRLAYAHGADPTALLALRMALSLPCFALAAWWFARRDGPLPVGDRVRLLALGVLGYHVASWLDFAGLRHIDAALERVVLFLYPTLIAVAAIVRGRESATARFLLTLAATYGGILLTWGDRLAVGGFHATAVGVGLVAASAVAFAAYMVLGEDLIRRIGGLRAAAVAMTGACVTTAVHGLVATPGALLHPTPAVFGLGAALAVLATVIPVFLAGLAVQHLGAARAAIVGCIAPALTALLAWALVGERLGMLGWLGIAVTMAGAWFAARR
jgi:drug/metabolite transporter (DMT)-like permease